MCVISIFTLFVYIQLYLYVSVWWPVCRVNVIINEREKCGFMAEQNVSLMVHQYSAKPNKYMEIRRCAAPYIVKSFSLQFMHIRVHILNMSKIK